MLDNGSNNLCGDGSPRQVTIAFICPDAGRSGPLVPKSWTAVNLPGSCEYTYTFETCAACSGGCGPKPCKIVETDGTFAFHCTVETTQSDGTKIATFSRPFDLMSSSGYSLPDTRIDPTTGVTFPITYYFNPLGSLDPSASILKDKGCEATGMWDTWDAAAYMWDSRLGVKGCTRLTGPAAGASKSMISGAGNGR